MNVFKQGDAMQLMKGLPSDSIDMIMTDPPYGFANYAWDAAVDIAKMWEEFKRVVVPNGAMVIMAAQPFTHAVMDANLENFHTHMIWIKRSPWAYLSAKRPLKNFEEILVFKNKKYGGREFVFNPQKQLRQRAHGGDFATLFGDSAEIEMHPKSILNFDVEGPRLHSAQKPIALFSYLIKTYTHAGMTVLDPFAGSGTTAVACIDAKRKYVLFEKDVEFSEKALKRIQCADKD